MAVIFLRAMPCRGNRKRVIADWARKASVTTKDAVASVARTCFVGPQFLISRFLISNGGHGKGRGPTEQLHATLLAIWRRKQSAEKLVTTGKESIAGNHPGVHDATPPESGGEFLKVPLLR